jgi:Ca2+/H+ antiporter
MEITAVAVGLIRHALQQFNQTIQTMLSAKLLFKTPTITLPAILLDHHYQTSWNSSRLTVFFYVIT